MPKIHEAKDHHQVVACEVRHAIFSPRGGIEGLLVHIGGNVGQVVFPPHLGHAVERLATPGKTIPMTLELEPPSPKGESDHPVYKLVALPGLDFAEPGGQHEEATIRGKVVRLNWARHGEANGVVLDTGDFIHLKPEGMKKAGLKVGDTVLATGEAKPMEAGVRAIEATEVNGTKIEGKPKHH